MSVGGPEEAVAFAAENELTVHSTHVYNDHAYLEIAPSDALTEFYTWADVTPGQQPLREVWRPFVWSAPDVGCNEALETVELGPLTVADILRGLRLS